MLPVLAILVGLVALVLIIVLIRRAGAVGWATLVGLIVVCAITNPDKAKHISGIKEKGMSEARASNDLKAMFVVGALGDVGAALIEPLLEYNSYLVFSTTAIREKTLSIGVLGQVFTVELKSLAEAGKKKR